MLDEEDLPDPRRAAIRDSQMDYVDRCEFYREYVPHGYGDTYEDLLAQGRAPRVAAAVLKYVAGQRGEGPQYTQNEIGSAFGVTRRTIREYYPEVAPALDPRNPIGLKDVDAVNAQVDDGDA